MFWKTQKLSAWQYAINSAFILFFSTPVSQLSFGSEMTWKSVVRFIQGQDIEMLWHISLKKTEECNKPVLQDELHCN